MRMQATLVQFWRLGHVVDRVVIRVAIFEPVVFAFLLPIVPTLFEFGLVRDLPQLGFDIGQASPPGDESMTVAFSRCSVS